MAATDATRFKFIGHALRGDGPFRPVVVDHGTSTPTLTGQTYLIPYPRESETKFARRNEVAFYASPLAQACSRFVGYISTKPVMRELPQELYASMAADIDGKGNSIEVWMQQFESEAKARGSMLLLVDMPATMAPSLGAQIQQRNAPFWSMVAPELLTDYEVGDDGRFVFAEFMGNWTPPDGGMRIPCTWHFDKSGWWAAETDRNGKKKILDQGNHPLGQCPLIIFTETGDFPDFGPFAAIADLSKRLFNLDSELDEILRAQTFSLLTMQVPDDTSEEQKIAMAGTVGATVGTNNLMVHSGSTPAFIAPSDGPATVYMERMSKIQQRIDEIGLNVASINQQESGIAMTMRFQAINAALARFSIRMEDLERRAWELSRLWLGMSVAPECEWPRDFNIADIEQELKILADMQASAMPTEVLIEQQKRIVALQFGNLEQAEIDEMMTALDERSQQDMGTDAGNVIQMPDRNTPVRDAIVKALNG